MATKVSLPVALAALLLTNAAATAAEMQVSGTLVYVPVSQDATKQSNGSTLIHTALKGVIRSDDEASPLNLSPQDCNGTVLISADGQSQTGGGHCTAIDKDGDAWWLSFLLTGDGSEWTVMGGTGKYEGMTGGGTTTPDAQFADGRDAEHYEGTLTMK